MNFENEMLEAEGARLFLRVAKLAGPIKAEVVVTHGLGEHSGRYTHVAAALAQAGLRMWGYDTRGHGRSTGPRGDVRRYGLLLDDLSLVCRRVRREGRGIFLLGHSMGGQVTLNFLIERPTETEGAVVAAPWLRLAFDPPLWRRLLARLARGILPRLAQGTATAAEQLSRDAEHVAQLADPHLTHHQLSARLFFALQRGGRTALERAGECTRPILLLHGGADRVTSAETTRLFFERAGSADKRFELYPEAVHETHNDLGRERMLRDVVAWISARAG